MKKTFDSEKGKYGSYDWKQNFLDRSFEDEFKKIKDLQRSPWVGKNYRNSDFSMLVIGDSNYASANPECTVDSEEYRELEKKWCDRDSGIDQIIENQFDYDEDNRTYRNINRLFADVPYPIYPIFWENTAYYNFIQELLPNRKACPQEDMQTYMELFHQLVDVLHPDFCLFLGVRAREWFQNSPDFTRYEKINGCVPASFSCIQGSGPDARKIPCAFIKHPSAAFSLDQWRAFLYRLEALKSFGMKIHRLNAEDYSDDEKDLRYESFIAQLKGLEGLYPLGRLVSRTLSDGTRFFGFRIQGSDYMVAFHFEQKWTKLKAGLYSDNGSMEHPSKKVGGYYCNSYWIWYRVLAACTWNKFHFDGIMTGQTLKLIVYAIDSILAFAKAHNLIR